MLYVSPTYKAQKPRSPKWQGLIDIQVLPVLLLFSLALYLAFVKDCDVRISHILNIQVTAYRKPISMNWQLLATLGTQDELGNGLLGELQCTSGTCFWSQWQILALPKAGHRLKTDWKQQIEVHSLYLMGTIHIVAPSDNYWQLVGCMVGSCHHFCTSFCCRVWISWFQGAVLIETFRLQRTQRIFVWDLCSNRICTTKYILCITRHHEGCEDLPSQGRSLHTPHQ